MDTPMTLDTLDLERVINNSTNTDIEKAAFLQAVKDKDKEVCLAIECLKIVFRDGSEFILTDMNLTKLIFP
jgi:hypothetical protein